MAMATNVMGLSIPQLRRWRAGEPLDHRQLNEPVDVLNSMTRGVAVPRQVTGQGRPSTEAGSLVAKFKLAQSAADFPDHLVCRTWDGTTEGETNVLVAKPWELRRTTFDGTTYGGVGYTYSSPVTRIGVIGDEEESQLIIPRYIVGDILVADKNVIGGTGVTVNGTSLEWEVRIGARAWTAEYLKEG